MHRRPTRRALGAITAFAAGVATLAYVGFGGGTAGAAVVSQPMDCGVGGSQTMKVAGTAPATVEKGSTFTVRLDPQAGTASGAEIKNMVSTFQAPTGSSLVAGSAQLVAGTSQGSVGNASVVISGSTVQLKVPGPVSNGASFRAPAFTFDLKATGAANLNLSVKVRQQAAYTLTAAGSFNVSCDANTPLAAFTTTKIVDTTTTTTSTTTSTTQVGPTVPTSTPQTIPGTTTTWTPSGGCGSVGTTTVPANVHTMSVTAVGASGGKGQGVAGATGANGAAAGQAAATFAVTPGQSVAAIIGCTGANGGTSVGAGGAGFGTGGNGGQGHGVLTSNHGGGGGGGASALCLGTTCAGDGGSSPLVVAGGGGGGASLNCTTETAGAGGAGGGTQAATSDGVGSGPTGSNGGNGSGAFTGGTGGAGGDNSNATQADGTNGADGTGGLGTNSGGGGAGGGYAGGTGGQGKNGGCGGGGGGGGGSSWVRADGTSSTFAAAGGSAAVTVSFTTDPTVVTPPACDIVPFATASALVAQQYQDFLGRAPTQSESTMWVNALDGGNCAADVLIAQLVPTDQTSTIAKFVRLYLAYFNRSPDLGGLNYWVDQIDNTPKTLGTASNQFAHMAEFRAKYGDLTNLQFVNLVYQNVLGRAGEPDGVAFWVNQLDTKAKNRGEVMTNFSEAVENRNKKTIEVNVVQLYLGMLRTTPTTAQLTAAAADIRTGGKTLADVAHGVRHSAAYDARIP